MQVTRFNVTVHAELHSGSSPGLPLFDNQSEFRLCLFRLHNSIVSHPVLFMASSFDTPPRPLPPPINDDVKEPHSSPLDKPLTPKLDPNPRRGSVEPGGATTPKATTSSQPPVETEDSENTSSHHSSVSDTIDLDTFTQILDLDEDGTQDFSRGMAWAYFSQAGQTFIDMDDALAKKDLQKLSTLGHFLKGSSAALGVWKVQASCEKIQHYGQLRDEEEGVDLTDEAALGKIQPLLGQVKVEYRAAEKWLRRWYEECDKKVPE